MTQILADMFDVKRAVEPGIGLADVHMLIQEQLMFIKFARHAWFVLKERLRG